MIERRQLGSHLFDSIDINLAHDQSGAFTGAGDQNAEWIKYSAAAAKSSTCKIRAGYTDGIFDGPRLEQRQPMLFFEWSRISGGWQNNEISPSESKISEQLGEPQIVTDCQSYTNALDCEDRR